MATRSKKSSQGQPDSITLKVTSEESPVKFDEVTISLVALGDNDDERTHAVVTLVDGEEVAHEAFDSESEARKYFRETVAEHKQADRDNREAHRDAAADTMNETADNFEKGTAERQLCRKLVGLFKAGRANEALAALQAAGL